MVLTLAMLNYVKLIANPEFLKVLYSQCKGEKPTVLSTFDHLVCKTLMLDQGFLRVRRDDGIVMPLYVKACFDGLLSESN